MLSLATILGSAFLLLTGQCFRAMAHSRQHTLSTPLKKEDSGSHPVMATSSVVSLSSGDFYFDISQIYSIEIDVPKGIHPATVISIDEAPNVASVHATLNRFRGADDVFNDSFLHVVIFFSDSTEAEILSERLETYLRSLGTRHILFLHRSSQGGQSISEGPYLATPEGLLKVWKLYSDTHGAFVASLVQNDQKGLKYLAVSSPDAPSNLAIAVPSRLYYNPSEDKPLDGWRVAIKDNIDVKGCRTYASCRAYGELYGIATESSPAAQKLLDLGAVIVGKTGMSEFADAEAPTGDFVDFHAPFNPRGDGSRTPGGSSYGSGAAVGAYDWIDFTLGTDTGGSVRQPAAHQAVFGLRPSRGQMSVEGTVIIHRDLDAIGIISRDLEILHKASKHFFKELPAPPQDKPAHWSLPALIYPTHLFPIQDESAQRLFNDTTSALERVLNVQRREVNLKEEWEKTTWYTGESFDDYFAPVLHDYVTWGQYHERAKFRNDYEAEFGRNPYVNPLARLRWELGSKMTLQYFDQVQNKRRQFQALVESVFGSNSVMLTPFLWGEPDSRDHYRPAPPERKSADLAWGYRPAFQSPYAGQPEIVFPVGQLPVKSAISSREEDYGVVASLIGSKGLDLVIVEITQKLLKEMGLPQSVHTGRVPFHKV